MVYHGVIEQWARASGIGDDEGVLGEGAQDSEVIEKCEGLVVVTFKFSSPSTLTLGVETLTDKLGVAETATVEVTRW